MNQKKEKKLVFIKQNRVQYNAKKICLPNDSVHLIKHLFRKQLEKKKEKIEIISEIYYRKM